MKSLHMLFFAVLTLLLLNCKKNNADQGGLDTIIGTWHVVSFSTIENEVVMKDEISTCQQMTQLVFNPDDTLASTSYNDSVEGCEVEDETVGTWQNLGNGAYRVTVTGEISSQAVELTSDLLIIRDEIADERLTYITVLQRVN